MFPRGRRGWLGSLQWLHHPPFPRRPLPWPSARHSATRQLSDLSWYTVSCLMIRVVLLNSIDLDSSSPLRAVSNGRCARTALEIAFPDMICSTAFGAYITQNLPLDGQCYQGGSFPCRKHLISVLGVVSDYFLAVTVVWLTISTTVAVQYIGAINVHVFKCIYCEDLR